MTVKKHLSSVYDIPHQWVDENGDTLHTARSNKYLEVEGMQEISKIRPSTARYERHKKERQEVADKVNGGKLGRAYRYHTSTRGTEAHIDFELGVFWKTDIA
jgi:hypothetical protein|tara:strand:+ start:194 stop:499 length:306 start_codon:yes stop_codon:yes gene_type:complete